MSWNPNPAVLASIAEGKIDELQDIITNLKETDDEVLKSYVMDIFASILQSSSTLVATMEYLQKLIRPIASSSQSIFCDVLWFWGTQINQDSPMWPTLCQLVKELVSSGLVDVGLIRLSLECNLLVGAGLASDEQGIQRRLIKLNTGLVYRQQKYNILREETEGFSRLVSILTHMPADPASASAHHKLVLSVIGTFDLDPNRVLDIILDYFESQTWNLSFIPLLKHFRKSSLAPILGRKFTSYHASQATNEVGSSTPSSVSTNNTAPTTSASTVTTTKSAAVDAAKGSSDSQSPAPSASPEQVVNATPASLYSLAGVLLANDLLSLSDILPYLSPDIEATAKTWKRKEAALRASISSFGVVSLTATASGNSVGATTAAIATVSKPVAPGLAVAAMLSAAPVLSTAPIVSSRPIAPALVAPVASKPNSSSTAPSSSSNGRKSEPAKMQSEVVVTVDDGDDDAAFSSTNAFLYVDGNQIIGLAVAVIRLRRWDLAVDILTLLESVGILPARIPEIRDAMISLFLWRLQPLHASLELTKLGLAGSSLTDSKPIDDAVLRPVQKLLGARESLTANDAGMVSGQYVPGQVAKFDSLDTFIQEAGSLLDRLGLFVYQSPKLFSTLCRLVKSCLELRAPTLAKNSSKNKVSASSSATGKQESTGLPGACDDIQSGELDEALQTAIKPVLHIITSVVLPALSSGEANAFHASQVWSVLEPLPFQVRFRLYDQWRGSGLGKEALGTKPHELVEAETKALHHARAVLKRLSKENIKVMGRNVAKYTHNCPMIVYNYVLNQIESFDNMIPIIVDALRYSTYLSRDVMAYLLVSQLKKDGDKLKKGDTNYSQWFASLSRFIATYYKRYPQTELKGLLHYLLQRLSAGESLDLLVLKDLLATMGGCETLLELSVPQQEGLAGGRALRSHVMGTSTNGVASNTSVRILREELTTSGVAIPMLLYIAQVRSRILHCTEAPQLKLISHMFDTAQDVLMQFTDFLVSGAKNIASMCTLMPSLSSLLTDSELSLPVAFQLTRPLIRAALQASENPEDVPDYLKSWHPLSESVLSVVQQHLPVEVWSSVSPELVVMFWSLSLFDILVPTKRYDLEIKRLKERYSDLDSRPPAPPVGADPEKAAKLRKAEMTRLLTDIKDLTDELESQKRHVDYTRKIFMAKRDQFIHNPLDSQCWAGVVAIILQHCVLDRVVMSPGDAIYSMQFFFFLHQLDTPGFSTLVFVHQVVQSIAPLIFCTTEAEASFLGYALNCMFGKVNGWHTSAAVFNLEKNRAGFITSIGSPEATENSSSENQVTNTADVLDAVVLQSKKYLTFEQYQKVCKSYWTKFKEILMHGFSTKEYIFLRCAMLVLSKVCEQYPVLSSQGDLLLTRVQAIEAEETDRGDLQLMAKSLVSLLKRQASTWINSDGSIGSALVRPPPQKTNSKSAAEKEKKDPEVVKTTSTSTTTTAPKTASATSTAPKISGAVSTSAKTTSTTSIAPKTTSTGSSAPKPVPALTPATSTSVSGSNRSGNSANSSSSSTSSVTKSRSGSSGEIGREPERKHADKPDNDHGNKRKYSTDESSDSKPPGPHGDRERDRDRDRDRHGNSASGVAMGATDKRRDVHDSRERDREKEKDRTRDRERPPPGNSGSGTERKSNADDKSQSTQKGNTQSSHQSQNQQRQPTSSSAAQKISESSAGKDSTGESKRSSSSGGAPSPAPAPTPTVGAKRGRDEESDRGSHGAKDRAAAAVQPPTHNSAHARGSNSVPDGHSSSKESAAKDGVPKPKVNPPSKSDNSDKLPISNSGSTTQSGSKSLTDAEAEARARVQETMRKKLEEKMANEKIQQAHGKPQQQSQPKQSGSQTAGATSAAASSSSQPQEIRHTVSESKRKPGPRGDEPVPHNNSDHRSHANQAQHGPPPPQGPALSTASSRGPLPPPQSQGQFQVRQPGNVSGPAQSHGGQPPSQHGGHRGSNGGNSNGGNSGQAQDAHSRDHQHKRLRR